MTAASHSETNSERWGLIAGNGRFPFLVLEGARSVAVPKWFETVEKLCKMPVFLWSAGPKFLILRSRQTDARPREYFLDSLVFFWHMYQAPHPLWKVHTAEQVPGAVVDFRPQSPLGSAAIQTGEKHQ